MRTVNERRGEHDGKSLMGLRFRPRNPQVRERALALRFRRGPCARVSIGARIGFYNAQYEIDFTSRAGLIVGRRAGFGKLSRVPMH